MDGQRFDDFTKGLGSKKSRRDVLKGVAGGALGVIGVSSATRPASAATACNSGLIPSLFGALARIFSSLGIYFPGPPEPPECTGSTVLNPDTCECECALTDAQCPGQTVVDVGSCECYCPLTVNDCPGGVDVETCTCIEIVCSEAMTACGAESLGCTCAIDIETQALLCVDHSGRSGIENECDSHSECPGAMVCAEDRRSCEGGYCYPLCGQVESYMLHFGPYELA